MINSILELPDARSFPWRECRDAPAGTITHERFRSEMLGNERDLWIHVPHGFENAVEPGLFVHFDGERCLQVLELPLVLDNLFAAGAIPPVVTAMVGNVDRGNELPCNPEFARMLAEELATLMRSRFGLSADPRKAVLAGQSYGGLASAWIAFQHPDVFGNVLSQSGSFWWKPNPLNDGLEILPGDVPDYAWLTSRFVEAPAEPIRFFQEVGTLELGSFRASTGPNMVECNRHFRDVLKAKGYDVAYREIPGGHDYVWWRGTIADGLIHLLSAKG
jgi:enterochelin esterase family protein